jgi:hypothetical protein
MKSILPSAVNLTYDWMSYPPGDCTETNRVSCFEQ